MNKTYLRNLCRIISPTRPSLTLSHLVANDAVCICSIILSADDILCCCNPLIWPVLLVEIVKLELGMKNWTDKVSMT